MKSKVKTQKKICYLSELTPEEIKRSNYICNLGYNKDSEIDFILSLISINPIVSLLYFQNNIIGICFADVNRKKVMKPLSKLFLYIHTLTVHPEFRGNGLCFDLVKNLINAKITIDGKLYHIGKSLNMLLHVRSNEENPNIAAIKCYKKHGFKLLDMIYETRTDGEINSAMIRLKNSKKSKKKKSKRK